MSAPGVFEDADQIVAASGKLLFQPGVIGESRELREERLRSWQRVVGFASGEPAQVEFWKVRGMRQQVTRFPFIQSEARDDLQRFRLHRISAAESLVYRLGVEPQLAD